MSLYVTQPIIYIPRDDSRKKHSISKYRRLKSEESKGRKIQYHILNPFETKLSPPISRPERTESIYNRKRH